MIAQMSCQYAPACTIGKKYHHLTPSRPNECSGHLYSVQRQTILLVNGEPLGQEKVKKCLCTLIWGFLQDHMRNCHIYTLVRPTWKKHMKGKFVHIYRNCFMLQTDPRGWKGSVSNGLGADISLPHCLATGIWNLVPKATSGPKSREASFGTTLWRHVQRYCAQFLLFMLIYVNLVLWGYNWNRLLS